MGRLATTLGVTEATPRRHPLGSMESSMSIKLTAFEAKASGYTLILNAVSKDRLRGIYIDTNKEGFICYIGPCEPGTGERVVCYHTDTGCDSCWLEPDDQCS